MCLDHLEMHGGCVMIQPDRQLYVGCQRSPWVTRGRLLDVLPHSDMIQPASPVDGPPKQSVWADGQRRISVWTQDGDAPQGRVSKDQVAWTLECSLGVGDAVKDSHVRLPHQMFSYLSCHVTRAPINRAHPPLEQCVVFARSLSARKSFQPSG